MLERKARESLQHVRTHALVELARLRRLLQLVEDLLEQSRGLHALDLKHRDQLVVQCIVQADRLVVDEFDGVDHLHRLRDATFPLIQQVELLNPRKAVLDHHPTDEAVFGEDVDVTVVRETDERLLAGRVLDDGAVGDDAGPELDLDLRDAADRIADGDLQQYGLVGGQRTNQNGDISLATDPLDCSAPDVADVTPLFIQTATDTCHTAGEACSGEVHRFAHRMVEFQMEAGAQLAVERDVETVGGQPRIFLQKESREEGGASDILKHVAPFQGN
ncbi:MAG: hypothetical protein AB203_00005 [Parcubacteria bacterium C7867-008]|nr:MAG: hypothetical protein AB203_00005 [Parcubacteria bacterium C7867-008]